MEEELHLVAKAVLVRSRKRIGPSELVDDGERCHDRILLVHLDPDGQPRLSVDLQLLALIKVHFRLAQLERRQHVQDLTNVRVGTLDQLVNDICRDFELFAAWVRELRNTTHR